jgi:D-beta-D-heptose 7-phosphate kinase/D-beta-D-heptose 1-phosphate adenosyltransferase
MPGKQNPMGFVPLDYAVLWREEQRDSGRRVAFTNGVFDLIHPGHLATLRHARSRADALIVGINSDESVMRLKGPKRPLLSAAERGKILSALEVVDLVVEFGEDDPGRLILSLRPDVLVKGGDYTLDQIVGRREVESWGGVVETVPLVSGCSTTEIVNLVLAKAGMSSS